MRTSHLMVALLRTVACGGEIRLAPETTRAGLGEGWSPLRTGGRTSCAFGSDYRFFTRSGASDRLLVFLHGGGACWSAETCAAGANATYLWEVDRRQDPGRQFGIFDLGHPENPVSDYSMVVAPTCTGDVHLGDWDASYTPAGTVASGARGSDTLTVRHRGQANVEAVLEWLYANFQSPVQVLVIGSSAGGVAAPFYADRIARRYPRARVVGLGDAAGGFRSDSIKQLDVARWGLPEALRRHAGGRTFPSPSSVSN